MREVNGFRGDFKDPSRLAAFLLLVSVISVEGAGGDVGIGSGDSSSISSSCTVGVVIWLQGILKFIQRIQRW